MHQPLSIYIIEIVLSVIVNAYKDNPIVRQQIPCQHQPRIDHAAPVGMKPSVGIGILEQAGFVLIIHSHLRIFFFLRAHEIIGIDEVVAGVVWRVYQDAMFDTKKKSLLRCVNTEKDLILLDFHGICHLWKPSSCSIVSVFYPPRTAPEVIPTGPEKVKLKSISNYTSSIK